MAYALYDNETLEDGIRRIALELLDTGREALTEPVDDDEDSIHTARKQFKKMRGLIRLVRDTIGKKKYRQENVFFRDLGRELSPVRDSHAIIESLMKLKEHCSDDWVLDNFSVIKWELEKHLNESHQTQEQLQNRKKKVREKLEKSYQRVANWPEIPHAFGSLEGGLFRVYQRGYNDFHQSYENPTTENLHDWRKRTKYLWYHYRLTGMLWPAVFEPLGEEVHKLSDYLGDDHDLAVLKDALRSDQLPFTLREPVSRLVTCLNNRRQKLQEQAFIAGRRIYALEPNDHIAWLRSCWEAHQQSLVGTPGSSQYNDLQSQHYDHGSEHKSRDIL